MIEATGKDCTKKEGNLKILMLIFVLPKYGLTSDSVIFVKKCKKKIRTLRNGASIVVVKCPCF